MSIRPSLEILFEDKHCLVVNKPARLLTASDKTGDVTLLSLLREYNQGKQAEGKKGYLVPLHFLDRPVSGVVMFAVSSKAASRLSAGFRERKIEKIYHAIVEGKPTALEDELHDYLLKNHETNVVAVVRPGTPEAKACSLGFKLLKTAGGRSLLEIKPHTGRSHQIRVQLASRQLPIFGDVKYGASQAFDGAIALHAKTVKFVHPVTKELMEISAPIPKSWSSIWAE